MDAQAKTISNVPKLITVEEAAHLLGVGRTVTYGLIRNGSLKSLQIGKRRLVPTSAIEEFIRRGTDSDE